MRLFRILIQDFKLLIRDTNSFLILILMPTILVLILSSVFKSSFTMNLESFDVAFLSDDAAISFMNVENLSLGQTLKEIFTDNKELKEIVRLKEVYNIEEGKKLVKEGKASAFIYVPKNFTTLFINGRPTEVEIIGDNKKSTHVSIVKGIVGGFNERLRNTEIGMNVISKQAEKYGITPQKAKEIINGISDDSHYDNSAIQIAKEASGSKSPVSSMQYYAVAMVAMYAMFTGLSIIQLMIEEKKNKTYFRIQASPVNSIEYIAGKLLGIIFVMLVQMSVLMAITKVVFGMDWGNLAMVMLVTVVYAFSVGCITLLLGFVSEDDRMISNLSMPIIFIFSFFGGSFIPREIMPGFAKHIQGVVPNGQALISYLNVIQGAGLAELSKSIIAMLGLGVVFLVASLMLAWKKGWSNVTIIRNYKAPTKTAV